MPAKLTQEQFINKANIKHNNYYDYSLVNYINANTKVSIICHKHGEFKQQPNNHLFGQGCIKCMGDNVRNARKFTSEQWVQKFIKIHGNRYDYSLFKVGKGGGTKYKSIIICQKHGEFLQRPQNHNNGEGCPFCNISKGEDEVEKYLIKNNIEYIREYRLDECFNPKTNKKLPFDFYIPKNNLVIEYQGEQHFKEMGGYFESRNGGLEGRQERDNIKKRYCLDNNYNFLEISYIDFNNINEILNKHINNNL